MCPRSRPPHRKKNYIKLPVRDFVSPFNAAWSLLKQGWQKDRVREQIMSVDPCAFGGPNCRKVATTATEQGVPMCEPCLQQYKFGQLSQRELDEQRRVVEAMYPSLSAQEQREERMFR